MSMTFSKPLTSFAGGPQRHHDRPSFFLEISMAVPAADAESTKWVLMSLIGVNRTDSLAPALYNPKIFTPRRILCVGLEN